MPPILSTAAGSYKTASMDCQTSQAIVSKVFEAAATTFISIFVLGMGFGFGGYLYHKFYAWQVLRRVENAFMGRDPVLELAALMKHISTPMASMLYSDTGHQPWPLLVEQAKIDAIVNGSDRGSYHLLLGERGTGKLSMLICAMQKVSGTGVNILSAHRDTEIFRVRLGRALGYEFHEDYIGSYFSVRGPRVTTALLDIERAFNKFTKVALKRRKYIGRPLVLIITSVHLLKDSEDGEDLLELLQQRAEQWAASDLATVIFSSDEYYVYERFRQRATRMEVTPIEDLPRNQAITALRISRAKYFQEEPEMRIFAQVYRRVGGRLAFLDRVAKSRDMLKACDTIVENEKMWFLNHCSILGANMSGDVVCQQKYAAAAMLLAQALVNAAAEADSTIGLEVSNIVPEIPLHRAGQIMARSDFIRSYNHLSLFSVTYKAQIRASSVPMQSALRAICSEPGFQELLEATLKRIREIDGLGRTREIVFKGDTFGDRHRLTSCFGDKGPGTEIPEIPQLGLRSL